MIGSKKNVKIENDIFDITYGTFDRNNPQVLFLKLTCWGKWFGDDDFSSKMNDFNNKIEYNVKNYLLTSNKFDNTYIFVPTYNKSKTINDKKSFNKPFYYDIDLTFRQSDNIEKDLNKIKNDINILVNDNIINVMENNTLLSFNKNKKKLI